MKTILTILIFFLFIGCGGGGGTSSTDNTNPSQSSSYTAYLIDDAISNVNYKTDFTSGVTNSDGGFEYDRADTYVEFKIGKLVIATYQLSNLNNDNKIFPTDLAGVERNDYNNTQVVKLLQTFQTLDNDGDPSNGIEIVDEVKEKFTLNQSINDIDVTDIATISEKVLIGRESAINHFKSTLIKYEVLEDVNTTQDNEEIQVDINSTVENNQSDENQLSIIKPTLQAFSGSIIENASSGAIIGTINFTSGDSNITDFNLTESNGTTQSIFAIDNSGILTLVSSGTIDYETQSSYSLKATATNSAGISNAVTVSIAITNASDTVPTIDNLTFDINENITDTTNPLATLVINTGDSAISSIVLKNRSDNSISSEFKSNLSGAITLKSGAIIDYESNSSYSLYAIASNSAGTSNEANITVTINDLKNESVPVIDPLEIFIDENTSVGTVVGTINISDTGDSNISSFTLLGDGSGNFEVNSSGTIKVVSGASLDYESKTIYNLSVYASNLAGNSITKNLTINIINIDDVPPVISSFTTAINENIAGGTTIGTLPITNIGDSAINFIVIKELSGTLSSTFEILPTGVIKTKSNATIDYEALSSRDYKYDLKAIAVNMAGDSNEVDVIISINDVLEDSNLSDETNSSEESSQENNESNTTNEELPLNAYDLGIPSTIDDINITEYERGNFLQVIKAQSAYDQGWTGEGVKVAIVDSGVRFDHVDIADNIYETHSLVDGSTGDDDYGHGSHVAGIMVGVKNDTGIMGVAYKASLISIKVSYANGNTTYAKMSLGIERAMESNAKVVNISLGGPVWSSTFDQWKEKMKEATRQDTTLIFSGGNSKAMCVDNNGTFEGCNYPAALPILDSNLTNNAGAWISVGAVDSLGVLASYSNKAGITKDWFICAPGGAYIESDGVSSKPIESAGLFNPDYPILGDYRTRQGTSQAAGVVSGIFTILAQKYPNLTGAQLRDIIFETAIDLGEPGVDEVYGHGMVDVEAIMAWEPK